MLDSRPDKNARPVPDPAGVFVGAHIDSSPIGRGTRSRSEREGEGLSLRER
jgi:hypothetical protein